MIFYSIYMNLIFLPMILISPILAISSNNWFSSWMSLELNMISFIPLLIFNKKFLNDSMIIYFLIQSLSSSIFLLSTLIFLFLNNSLIFKLFLKLTSLSLLIKLGIVPFHFWFLNLMISSSWMNCFLLSSWQKIIPMILLFNLFKSLNMHYIILFSSLMSTILSMNLTNLRMIMGFSSINHTSWMLITIPLNKTFWLTYMITYMNILITMFLMFNLFNMNYINQLMFLFNSNNLFKIFIFFNFLSLSGLPPFLGFIMKWMMIFISLKVNLFFSILILIMCSLIFMYIYMFIYINMMMMMTSINLNFNFNFSILMKFSSTLFLKIYMFISSFILFLTPFIFII